MSGIASSRTERFLLPGWLTFCAVNLVLMFALPGATTIPFHLVWVSMALVYGLQPWPLPMTFMVLGVVCAVTGTALVWHVRSGVIPWQETAEVPLMTLLFLVMVWHVRRRVAAVQEARRLAESEHRMHERQRRFIRFASHELRTPLTVARGYAELIRDAPEKPLVEQDVGIVLDELDKLERIAARLLTLAQIDEPATLKLQAVDLDLLLDRSITRWRAAASREWVLDSSAGVLMADPERLETALDSLLENAVRYTDEQGLIRLRGHRDDGSVVIQVSDDGLGIPFDELGLIFESFRRGPTRGGTGMGLAIVKAIVEAHAGTMTVQSLAGRGAEFTVRLPAGIPARASTPLGPADAVRRAPPTAV